MRSRAGRRIGPKQIGLEQCTGTRGDAEKVFWETAPLRSGSAGAGGKFPGETIRAPEGFRGSGPREQIGFGGETMGWKRSGETNAPIFDREPKSARFSGAAALVALDAPNTALNNLQKESYLTIRAKGKKKNGGLGCATLYISISDAPGAGAEDAPWQGCEPCDLRHVTGGECLPARVERRASEQTGCRNAPSDRRDGSSGLLDGCSRAR